jgi:hypothetical protein
MQLVAIATFAFLYALWRDLFWTSLALCDTYFLIFLFLYALWRDLVLDPAPVGGAVTSADASRLHRPPA